MIVRFGRLFGLIILAVSLAAPLSALACEIIEQREGQYYMTLCFGSNGFPEKKEYFSSVYVENAGPVFLKQEEWSYQVQNGIPSYYKSFAYEANSSRLASVYEVRTYTNQQINYSFNNGTLVSMLIQDRFESNPSTDTFVYIKRGAKVTYYHYYRGIDASGPLLSTATIDSATNKIQKIRFYKEGTQQVVAEKSYVYRRNTLRQIIHRTLKPTPRVVELVSMTTDGKNFSRYTQFHSDGSVAVRKKYAYTVEGNNTVEISKSIQPGGIVAFVERDSFTKSRPTTTIERYKKGGREGIGYGPFQIYRSIQNGEDQSRAPLYAVRLAAASEGLVYGDLPNSDVLNSFTTRWSSSVLPGRADYLALLGRELEVYRPHAPTPPLVLTEIMFGDSQTYHFRPEYYPGFSSSLLNQGIPGETLNGILSRLSLFNEDRILRVYLQGGIVEIMQGRSDESILQSLNNIIDLLLTKHGETEIVVQSILPIGTQKEVPSRNITNARIAALNLAIQNLVNEKGPKVRYLNVHSSLVNPVVGALHTKYSSDGLYLNQMGYAAWARVISQITGYPMS